MLHYHSAGYIRYTDYIGHIRYIGYVPVSAASLAACRGGASACDDHCFHAASDASRELVSHACRDPAVDGESAPVRTPAASGGMAPEPLTRATAVFDLARLLLSPSWTLVESIGASEVRLAPA